VKALLDHQITVLEETMRAPSEETVGAGSARPATRIIPRTCLRGRGRRSHAARSLTCSRARMRTWLLSEGSWSWDAATLLNKRTAVRCWAQF